MPKKIFIAVLGCLILLLLPVPGYSLPYSRAPMSLGSDNMKEFVTPDDLFVEIQVKKITADCDDKWWGYSSIHYWVGENVRYSYDLNKEYWQLPCGTLAKKMGDCEDMALLRCSMLTCYDWLIDETDDKWYVLVICFKGEEGVIGYHASVIGNTEGYAQIYDYHFDNYGKIVKVDEIDAVWEDYKEFWNKSLVGHIGEVTEVTPIYVFNDKSCEELYDLDDLEEFLLADGR